jgi:hypothetical protein
MFSIRFNRRPCRTRLAALAARFGWAQTLDHTAGNSAQFPTKAT